MPHRRRHSCGFLLPCLFNLEAASLLDDSPILLFVWLDWFFSVCLAGRRVLPAGSLCNRTNLYPGFLQGTCCVYMSRTAGAFGWLLLALWPFSQCGCSYKCVRDRTDQRFCTPSLCHEQGVDKRFPAVCMRSACCVQGPLNVCKPS